MSWTSPEYTFQNGLYDAYDNSGIDTGHASALVLEGIVNGRRTALLPLKAQPQSILMCLLMKSILPYSGPNTSLNASSRQLCFGYFEWNNSGAFHRP